MNVNRQGNKEFPLTWIEKELDSTATRFLKKWSGLAKSANTSTLFLPRRDGGLDLPSLSSLYKHLQVSRQCQLLTSPDPCVRRIAENALQDELMARRKKFRPAVTVRDVMAENLDYTRRSLRMAVKKHVVEVDSKTRREQL